MTKNKFRFTSRISVPRKIDFPVYILFGLLTIIASVLTRSEMSDYGKLAAVALSNLIAVSFAFGLLLLFNLIWKVSYSTKMVGVPLLLILGGIVGALKGVSTWAMISLLGYPEDISTGLYGRSLLSITVGVIVIPSMFLFISLRQEYQDKRARIIEDKVALETGSRYPKSLVDFISEAKDKLDDAKSISDRNDLAQEIKSIVEFKLKPLSKKIWAKEANNFPSLSLYSLAIHSLKRNAYSLWIVPVWVLTTLSPTLRVLGEEGLWIQILRGILLAAGLYGLKCIQEKVVYAETNVRLTIYFTGITMIAVGQVFFGSIFVVERDFGGDLGFAIANLIWLIQLTLLAGIAKSFFQLSERIDESDLTTLSDSAIQEMSAYKTLQLRDRNLANFLHGTVQSSLLNVAAELERDNLSPNNQAYNTSTTSNNFDPYNSHFPDLKTDIEEIEKTLQDALKEFESQSIKNIDELKEALQANWGGVVKIEILIHFKTIAIPSFYQTLHDTINEAIGNAVRHGLASEVNVVLSEDLVLTIEDDGVGAVKAQPGLGSTHFDAVSESWELTTTDQGGKLTLKMI